MYCADENVKNPCTVKEVLRYITNVKHLRAFGRLLEIEPGKLDQFEKGPLNEVLQKIISEWLKKFNDDVNHQKRWKELYKVLKAPAVDEVRLAKKLQAALDLQESPLRRGSSFDSAFGSISSASSVTLSTPQYQLSYIGKVYKHNLLNLVVNFHTMQRKLGKDLINVQYPTC